MNILILDGANKNTLAIVRHLGRLKAGRLSVVSYQKASIAFFSKYVSSKLILPHPKNEQLFIESLFALLKAQKFDLLIPVGYTTFKICVRYQFELGKLTSLIVPSPEAMTIAESKLKSQAQAEKLGIPVPQTMLVNAESEIEKMNLKFPVVIKAPVELGKSLVNYAWSHSELVAKFREMSNKYDTREGLPIIQEYVSGEGVGFFAYYSKGKCRRIFMHRRIREYPATGGASVCAAGFYDLKLEEYGKKLLDSLEWNGVAMVEFKRNTQSGEYVLMEINPKFWGSLDLSLVSGIIFPYFMVQETKGEEIDVNLKFDHSKRFQWILNGELYYFFSRPLSLVKIIRDLFKSKNDIWFRDPLPNLFQAAMIPIDIYKKLVK